MKNIHSSAKSSCLTLQALRGIEGMEDVITGGPGWSHLYSERSRKHRRASPLSERWRSESSGRHHLQRFT